MTAKLTIIVLQISHPDIDCLNRYPDVRISINKPNTTYSTSNQAVLHALIFVWLDLERILYKRRGKMGVVKTTAKKGHHFPEGDD